MFSKCVKLNALLVALAILSACGNSEDADKIKDALEVNELNVTALEISSPNTSLEIGAFEQFSASGIVDEGNKPAIDATDKVRWSSSDASLASIDQSGKLTSLADGLVTITASWADLSASKDIMLSSAALSSITVIDNVSPASVCRTNNQLTAEGLYADATTRDITDIVSWSSADESKLSIDQTGNFTSLGSGSVEVFATRNTISGSTNITIEDDLESISISSTGTEVSVNASLAFSATGTFSDNSQQSLTEVATWQTADATKLSISKTAGSKGVVKGIAEGTVNISASCNSTDPVSSAPTAVTVTPQIVIDGVTINEDSSYLEFKLIDSPEQLVAQLKRNDGLFSTDVTDDDNTDWRIDRVTKGEGLNLSNTKGSKGEITFTEPGVTFVSVRYRDSVNNVGPFTYEIEIEVVE